MRSLAAALLITIAAGSAAADEHLGTGEQIIGGTRTSVGDFPSVVAIAVGQGLCTGTLVAPTWVMTAGHCIDPKVVGSASADALLKSIRVFFNTVDVTKAGGTTVRAKSMVGAGFDVTKVGKHDLALIELATAVTDIAPTPVNLDASKAPIGTIVSMVGYGATGSGASGTVGVEYTLTNRTAARCADVVPPLTGEAAPQDADLLCFAQTDSKGKCSGDSGGPSFAVIDGVRQVVGVTSFGDQECVIFGADTRTDIEAAFLTDHVPNLCLAGTDCASDGGGCCDASGRGGPTALLGIAVLGLGLRRRRQ